MQDQPGMKRMSGWTCPGCLRLVPARVEECYCGVKRSQLPPAPASDRGTQRVLLLGIPLTGALVLLATVPLWRSHSPAPPVQEARPSPGWAPRLASPESPARPEPRASASSAAPAVANLSIPETTATEPPAPFAEAAAPPPEPEAAPLESLDDRRQRAAEELNRAFEQIAVKAERVRMEMRHYRDGCWTDAGPLPTSGCSGARQELRENFEQLRSQVEDAEERARHEAVYPGVRAEIRRRHALDEEAWNALLRSATEILE